MRATLVRDHIDFQVPYYNLKIAPGESQSYKFCVIDGADVRAQTFAYTDPTTCPDSYTNYDLVVSRTDPNATVQDLVWRNRNGDHGVTWVRSKFDNCAYG